MKEKPPTGRIRFLFLILLLRIPQKISLKTDKNRPNSNYYHNFKNRSPMRPARSLYVSNKKTNTKFEPFYKA